MYCRELVLCSSITLNCVTNKWHKGCRSWFISYYNYSDQPWCNSALLQKSGWKLSDVNYIIAIGYVAVMSRQYVSKWLNVRALPTWIGWNCCSIANAVKKEEQNKKLICRNAILINLLLFNQFTRKYWSKKAAISQWSESPRSGQKPVSRLEMRTDEPISDSQHYT